MPSGPFRLRGSLRSRLNGQICRICSYFEFFLSEALPSLHFVCQFSENPLFDMSGRSHTPQCFCPKSGPSLGSQLSMELLLYPFRSLSSLFHPPHPPPNPETGRPRFFLPRPLRGSWCLSLRLSLQGFEDARKTANVPPHPGSMPLLNYNLDVRDSN